MRKALGPRCWIALGCLLGLTAVYACGPRPHVTITSPSHGAFTLDTSITLIGTIANIPLASARVTVNGTIATLNPDATWSVTLPVDTGRIMNPYLAVLRNLSTNQNVARARVLVH